MLTHYLISACCFLALLYSAFLIKKMMQKDAGDEKVRSISNAIQAGAESFLSRQYRSITYVGIAIFGILMLLTHWYMAVGFLIGAVLSGLCGYIGMMVSVRANVRTTVMAQKSGMASAFDISFKAGAITGFLVVGLGLMSVFLCYFFMNKMEFDFRAIVESLIAVGFGASLISIFARLGGGIFTKGADVGADLVGKVESNIPEDDPRNPAVIADNVGDNVGDCAGMAADIFETYVVTLVASMHLAFVTFSDNISMFLLPVIISAVSIPASIIGSMFVKLGNSKNIMGSMYKGVFISAFLSFIMTIFVISTLVGFDKYVTTVTGLIVSSVNMIECSLIGLLTGLCVFWITSYYTDCKYRPVSSIANASRTGAGTNIIQGLGMAMESCVMPAFVISLAIIMSYFAGGLFGIAISSISMLSISGIVVALDAYGPVTDNAGGIAEMSGMDKSVRDITDSLDAVGNTTKAITKGYSIGSAVLAALVLFTTFIEDLRMYFPDMDFVFSLSDPFVLIGMLVGGAIVYLFSSLSMLSVGKAAISIVLEVRRQFKEMPGIMKNTQKPDYSNAIDILTKTSIREMILPSVIPVIVPIMGYMIISYVFGKQYAFNMLGGLMIGSTIVGFFLAVFMTSGGGAYDNAKKLIETSGLEGFGKGSDSHAAAVVGDTVGDPLKDTSGPALNPMMKAINIVCSIIAMMA